MPPQSGIAWRNGQIIYVYNNITSHQVVLAHVHNDSQHKYAYPHHDKLDCSRFHAQASKSTHRLYTNSISHVTA